MSLNIIIYLFIVIIILLTYLLYIQKNNLFQISVIKNK